MTVGGSVGYAGFAVEDEAIERAILACVRDFYAGGREDPLLGPVFNDAIEDWDAHIVRVADFWSRVLLKTERYGGFPFPAHARLPLQPEHFPRWLELFEASVRKNLPEPYAQLAVGKARQMAQSFLSGIFPFIDENGRPSRRPA